MPMEVWRPGDYRVCPTCRTRHKVQDIECSRCKTVLVGTRIHRAAPTPVSVAGARSSRGLRVLVAAGLLVALGAGLWVRSVFRGVEIEDSVVAASAAAPVPRAAEPAWQPPVLSYPSMVGYNTGVPPSMAPLTIHEGPGAGTELPASEMMSIAPSSEPLRQRAFTNEDLARVRSGDGLTGVARTDPAPAVAALPAAIPAARPATSEPSLAAPVPVAASAAVGIPSATIAETAARAVPSEEAKEWTSRLHDRQEDVQEAQAKVRRMEAQAEARRVQLGAAAAEDARKKAERDLMDALDDLEKAERKLARAQRELDETHERAREKGVRLER